MEGFVVINAPMVALVIIAVTELLSQRSVLPIGLSVVITPIQKLQPKRQRVLLSHQQR